MMHTHTITDTEMKVWSLHSEERLTPAGVCIVLCTVVKVEKKMSGKGQPLSHHSRGPLSASSSTSSCDIL